MQEAWLDRALDSAGIDRRSWRPGRGVEENRRTVEAVYGYYGRLFLEHPYLEWAGLAGHDRPGILCRLQGPGLAPGRRACRGDRGARAGIASDRHGHRSDRAPTRESVGLAAGTGSRVWMNPGRTPFDVTIALPGGRLYHARAEMAVMLRSARVGDPDRLTVQLPPADSDTAAQPTGEYAAQWGFRADAVAA